MADFDLLYEFYNKSNYISKYFPSITDNSFIYGSSEYIALIDLLKKYSDRKFVKTITHYNSETIFDSFIRHFGDKINDQIFLDILSIVDHSLMRISFRNIFEYLNLSRLYLFNLISSIQDEFFTINDIKELLLRNKNYNKEDILNLIEKFELLR